ncbi:MAG: DUF2029 domain-containing protein [Rudanella sp.]|nr:DUF2029 domain-containing protein [Rudanella sp.]
MTLLYRVSAWLTLRRLMSLFLVVFCGVALQKYALGSYNNYLMFARPFHNLLLDRTLYGLHPDLYADSYKYSPTFAWLMAPFYYLPIWLGVLLWNGLNTVVLLYGVWSYGKDYRAVRMTLLIVFAEALITAQNMQSNNLIVGVILLGLADLRDKRPDRAAFWLVLCGFIKFYGGAAAILFLLYPHRGRFVVACIGWTVLLASLPLTLIPLSNLVANYQAWFEVIIGSKLGLLVSVPGICEAWFGMAKTDANLRMVELVGLLVFLAPLVQISRWKQPLYRQQMVASFLLFVILFNKMAESPTYILAVTGVAIWWCNRPVHRLMDPWLLGLVIVFTSLSPTDLFPPSVREGFFQPNNIKAVPCLLVWLRVVGDLWNPLRKAAPIIPTLATNQVEETRLQDL